MKNIINVGGLGDERPNDILEILDRELRPFVKDDLEFARIWVDLYSWKRKEERLENVATQTLDEVNLRWELPF